MATGSNRRASVFRETGLLDEDASINVMQNTSNAPDQRPQSVRFRSRESVHLVERFDNADAPVSSTNAQAPENGQTHWMSSNAPLFKSVSAAMLLVAAALSLLQGSLLTQEPASLGLGVEGGVIPSEALSRTRPDLSKRSDSPTDICFRWAQQSAVINGTLYLYGGEASTESGQTSNTWNNDFLTLDLTSTWQISSPSLTGLPRPSGPPAVALGALWNSHDALYLYGGEFSSAPAESPAPMATWEYDIASQSWIEHAGPTTSSGDNAPSNEDAVQRSAEGAAASVPSLGRGFYFGGHEDEFTTPGWSYLVARIYLQSLLEFTFPGYTNDQVNALSNSQSAGTGGNYRNITEGGLQTDAGFTKRADGLLIYVPGFGAQGILLALAGGTNTTFTQMNEINVYDIATSSWYSQSTSGSTPNIRVNPCAVAASAPDGSSTNIYMFGGQALQPAADQQQYDDMWILTLPSFTWIEVDMSNQSVPYGRSGHTCNVWDGQMVMVGGYVGDQLSCESPGIYVFDLGNLQWVQQFTASSPGTDDSSSTSSSSSSSETSASSTFNSTGSTNPFNQQPAQIANGSDPGGLEGSYGYVVPQAVIDIVGGNSSGGATVTAPVVTATAGPLATGKPITYTITGPGGSTVTETASPNSGGGSSSNGSSTSSGSTGKAHSGPNIAAIVVGVICGILFIIVCYLSFCAYVYRKQLNLYKRHVEMSQRQARGEKVPAIPGLLASDSSAKSSSSRDRGAGGARSGLLSNNPYLGRSNLGPGAGTGEIESLAGSGGGVTSSSGGGRSGRSGGGAAAASGGGGSSGAAGYTSVPTRRSSERSSTEDLLAGQEPSYVGVLLHPRRSLRVVNRD